MTDECQQTYGNGKDANRPRLAIEDPNNNYNDISVGTKEIDLILECFSRAYDALKDRMVSLATSKPTSPRKDACFLDTILSACYDEYTEQRVHLRTVFESDPRFAEYYGHLTPPPPPSESEYDPEDAPVPAPPPLPASPPPLQSKPKLNRAAKRKVKPLPKKNRKALASLDRATRLKQLLPELAHTIPESISAQEAFTLSGYQSQSEFDSDLSRITLAQ
jgi:non-canonical poly(A) RNA polymerase PAPD5/7